MNCDGVNTVYMNSCYPGIASLVFNCRKEYYKNNVFAVNHIMLNILYETVFGYLRRSGGRP
jgi:hypothetical protein